MRIHGPNQTNFNPYREHANKSEKLQKDHNQEDHLEISSEAKELQGKTKPETQRAKHVQAIKNAVQSGKYEINHEKTAKQMVKFWSGN